MSSKSMVRRQELNPAAKVSEEMRPTNTEFEAEWGNQKRNGKSLKFCSKYEFDTKRTVSHPLLAGHVMSTRSILY